MNELPQPKEQHQRLHVLAGGWIGEEKLNASPWGPGGTAIGRYTARVDIDGFFVIQDYSQERDGRVMYRGHGIFGWDDERKEYTWYWVDSTGSVPPSPSRGQWEGETLVLEHEPVGERRGRYTYRFTSADSYTFQIENSHDGGNTWSTFMEASYRRA